PSFIDGAALRVTSPHFTNRRHPPARFVSFIRDVILAHDFRSHSTPKSIPSAGPQCNPCSGGALGAASPALPEIVLADVSIWVDRADHAAMVAYLLRNWLVP